MRREPTEQVYDTHYRSDSMGVTVVFSRTTSDHIWYHDNGMVSTCPNTDSNRDCKAVNWYPGAFYPTEHFSNVVRSDVLKLYLIGPDKNGVITISHDDGRTEYQYSTGDWDGNDFQTHTTTCYPFPYPTYKIPPKKRNIGRCRQRVKK